MIRRVVITGIGAITPIGNSVGEFWRELCQGKSGVSEITRFDTSNYRTKIAAEIKDFNPYDHLDYELARRTDPCIHYALHATKQAVEDSGLIVDDSNADKVGVIVGTSIGGISSYDRHRDNLLRRGPAKTSPYFITSFLANMVPGEISIMLGAKGPNKCVVTACAAGANAIGDAFDLIKSNKADVLICGGTEASIVPSCVAALSAMGALSASNDPPEKASRPFDRNRNGFVLGEGAGIVVLEELSQAKERGARIYAEIIGYAHNSDARHITEPSVMTQSKCIELAIEDACRTSFASGNGIIHKWDIDYVNAHGTSTKWNDITETKALKLALGGHACEIPISSNKSMIGHLLGAAGAVEAISTILTIKNSIIPPTINLEDSDPECDLDYVPNVAREKEVDIALSNSFGFGGHNAVLVFRKWEDKNG